MTRTAIVSALRDELAAVLDLLPDERKSEVAGRQFWRGHLHGFEVVATLSGIGKVAAAATATLLIERFKVDHVLFTGVAGGLGPGVRVGDLVLADELLQHDLNAAPLFPVYEVPGTGLCRFPADPALSANLRRAALAALVQLEQVLAPGVRQEFGLHAPRLHQGLLISGDRFISTAAESQALRLALPDALAVEMEGAAFAQVCRDFGVPLAVLRTVSDRADDGAQLDFERFLRGVASHYSATVVEYFFRDLAL